MKKYEKIKISKKLFEQEPSGGKSTPLITNLITKIVIYPFSWGQKPWGIPPPWRRPPWRPRSVSSLIASALRSSRNQILLFPELIYIEKLWFLIKKYKKVKISRKFFEQEPSGGESTPLISNLIIKIVIYRVLTTPRDTPHARGFGGGQPPIGSPQVVHKLGQGPEAMCF